MLSILKKFLLGLAAIAIILTGIYLVYFNDPLPEGRYPNKADELSLKMLEALNYDAYKQTRYLEWTYRGGRNTYRWDKAKGLVEISWKDYTGEIYLSDPNKSMVKEKGKKVEGEKRSELIEEAIANFNNDSFWLVAPFKIFDKGTKRSLVTIGEGRNGILVTYTQGGNTPGDSYLWELNEHYIPINFRMWVQILPLKGLSASWDGWHRTQSGAWLPQYHKIGPITLDLGTVSATK